LPGVELDDEKLTELPVALYAVLMKMNTSMVFGSFCIAGHLAIRATTILETLRPGDCREICEEIVRRRDEFDEFSKALSQ